MNYAQRPYESHYEPTHLLHPSPAGGGSNAKEGLGRSGAAGVSNRSKGAGRHQNRGPRGQAASAHVRNFIARGIER